MFNWLKTLWDEPRSPHAPAPGWPDALLVAVVVGLALTESLVREGIVWPGLSLALTSGFALLLFWRRALPTLALIIPFGVTSLVQVIALRSQIEWDGLYTGVFVLIFPYALLRWGSGKEICVGLAVVAVGFTTTMTLGQSPLNEIIGASLFILFPSALGASIRYRDAAQRRSRDQVRLRERERLARELHDTVAHYVSAIAIQAQAGRAQALARPDAPLQALAVIEEAASRTLSEMRNIVKVMRSDSRAEFAPAASLKDIQQLASDNTYPLQIEIECEGQLEDLDSTMTSTLFRLTQESITNAVRHAQGAQRIDVRLRGAIDQVHLTVSNDGTSLAQPPPAGLGLQGMAERVALLGGTFTAGPGAEGGWRVEAMLPRSEGHP